MSRPPYPTYPYHHPHHGRPFIVVHDHDILCGRGVNIAQHPGNERFRALVNSRHDESYCTAYTTSEKRAVAEDILRHIKSLEPPGRFLKRSGRSHNSRGLNGPWEQLSDREAIKKTCQALRDCNRTDRTGYAATVRVPEDVKQNVEQRQTVGLSNKEHAAAAVASAASTTRRGDQSNAPSHAMKRSRTEASFTSSDDRSTSVSPSVENAAEWLKKQRVDESNVAGNAAASVSNNVTSNVTPPTVQTTASSAIVTNSPSIPVAPGISAYPSDPMLTHAASFPGHSSTPAALPGYSRSISPVVTTAPSPMSTYDQHQAVSAATMYLHPGNPGSQPEYAVAPPPNPPPPRESTYSYHQYYPANMGSTAVSTEVKYSGDSAISSGTNVAGKSGEDERGGVPTQVTAGACVSTIEIPVAQAPQHTVAADLGQHHQHPQHHHHHHPPPQQHHYHQQYDQGYQHQNHHHQHYEHQHHQQQHHAYQHRPHPGTHGQSASSSAAPGTYHTEEVQRGSPPTGPSGEL